MNKLISPKIIALTFGVLVVSFLAALYVVAWQEPGLTPPQGNVPTPLNVSATAQTKAGDLTINGVLKTLKDMIVDVVTIKSNGAISTNLNSDKLDDYHAADLMAAGGGGAAVNCQVICNGSCPSAPSGWTLVQSTGQSGGLAYSLGSDYAAAGRCALQSGSGWPPVPYISPGVERMCCYFYTP